MLRMMFSIMLLLFGLASLAQARPTLHCGVGSTITFTASVMWNGTVEEHPFIASFYANTGECFNITCADPNDNGDMWVTGPEGVSNRDITPSGGNLVIEIDLSIQGDEGWHTFQMFTSDNSTENFSCTLSRTSGGC